MRKPIDVSTVYMAISDLLSPFLDSSADSTALQRLLADRRSGLGYVRLVLIAVDQFGTVVFPHRSPLISSKLCSFFILATWTDHCDNLTFHSPYLFALKLNIREDLFVAGSGMKLCESPYPLR